MIYRLTKAPKNDVINALANELAKRKKLKSMQKADGFDIEMTTGVFKKNSHICSFNVSDDRITFTSPNAEDHLFGQTIIHALPDDLVNDMGIKKRIEEKSKLIRSQFNPAIPFLNDTLAPEDTIQALALCTWKDKMAAAVITKRQVIVRTVAALDVTPDSIVIDLDQITSVSADNGLMGGTVKITVSNQTVEIKRVSEPAADTFASVIRSQREVIKSPKTEPAQAPAQAASDTHADLVKLAELHAAGILTDEEFKAAKAKALGI